MKVGILVGTNKSELSICKIEIINLPKDHNYCRNPTGDDSGPWCYVKDDDDRFVEWEECKIDQVEYCADPSAYRESDDVKPETTTTTAKA